MSYPSLPHGLNTLSDREAERLLNQGVPRAASRPHPATMASGDGDGCGIRAPRRRRRSSTVQMTHPAVIDLTKDSAAHDCRRNSPTSSFPTTPLERPVKRRNLGQFPGQEEPAEPSSRLAPTQAQVDLTADDDEQADEVEALDLTLVDTDTDLRTLQEAQRQRHENQQHILQDPDAQKHQHVQKMVEGQAERRKGPFKLEDLQCVICMEQMTNVTVTHCGHIFCHSCLLDALIAGERQSEDPRKVQSRCPICRTKVLRDSKTAQTHVIPLELKLKSAKARGKEKA